MKMKSTIKLIALACVLNLFGCGTNTPASKPASTDEELLVEESAEYYKALFSATVSEDIKKHLLPGVDKIKDQNKAAWAKELKKDCGPVGINLQREANTCRIKAIGEGVKTNPSFESLKDYTFKSCRPIIEHVSDECNGAMETVFKGLFEPAKALK